MSMDAVTRRTLGPQAADQDPGRSSCEAVVVDGEVPTRRVALTLVMRVEATLATHDTIGQVRDDVIDDLCRALELGIEEDVPYDVECREPGDLIQDIQVRIAVVDDTADVSREGPHVPDRVL